MVEKAGDFAVDLAGKVRAHVSAAGPAGLPVAALSAVDCRGSGLVVATLVQLLEWSGGASGLARCAASSGGIV